MGKENKKEKTETFILILERLS